jgi:hypothetical protein
MDKYRCWTKHGETGVMMEENEEDDNNHIPDDVAVDYAGLGDSIMGEADEDEDDEGANKEVAEDGVDEGPDKLDQMIRDEKEQLESEKEKEKLYCMLEDHKTLLFPGCDEDLKKLDTTLGLLQ